MISDTLISVLKSIKSCSNVIIIKRKILEM